jgi:apolipoprotein N-acyltransferase
MSQTDLKAILVRNIGFWIVAALAYPIAHWIPTATGHPPRIFEVLIPVFVLGLGLASNAVLAAALRADRRERVADGRV